MQIEKIHSNTVQRQTLRDMQHAPLFGLALVLGVLLCLASEGQALADRAISPTDGLGDWAIQSEFTCCGGASRNEIQILATSLKIQVWPLDGLVLGVSGAHLEPIDESTIEPVFTDFALNTGYLVRPSPSLILRGDLRVELPTSQSFAGGEQTEVDIKGLLGFSFTPRHDFFLGPIGGFNTGGNTDTTYRAGWSGGMAYQLSRFSMVLYGINEWYSSRSIGPRFGGGGGFYLGAEIGYGVTLGVKLDSRRVPEAVGGKGVNIMSGLTLNWVFFPGDRTNTLRNEDRERGRGWQWWNPDPNQLQY